MLEIFCAETLECAPLVETLECAPLVELEIHLLRLLALHAIAFVPCQHLEHIMCRSSIEQRGVGEGCRADSKGRVLADHGQHLRAFRV